VSERRFLLIFSRYSYGDILYSLRQWDNLTLLYMDEEVKEQAKAILGLKAVPYLVVVGKVGQIPVDEYSNLGFYHLIT
jgi:hypothetical protein